MSAFVHLIADYGKSDPAFSEVVHRLKCEDPDIDVQPTAVAPFSTIATGFWIEQLGLHNPVFDDLLVYSNTAPRTKETTPERADEGGRLCYLELDTGTPVIAVDAGYNLSFVKDRIHKYREVETPSNAGQFRSRDTFPTRVVEIANGNMDSLGRELSTQQIPPKPEQTVCHVDGYGNVKTSIRSSTFDPGSETVTLEIHSETREIAVRESVSEIEEGSLGLVPGSAGGEDPYEEIVLRGGSAAVTFNQPRPGDSIMMHV